MNGAKPQTTQVETGQISSKHLLALRDYWTPARLWNLLQCEVEKRRRVLNTRAMPYVAVIDVTNACNLRCPGCPTGAGIYGRPKTLLDLGRLERFLDETGRYLLLANLYNWGETLLHPQAPDIVKMVHARRIFTSISTNLNIRNPDRLDAICDAGLDYLIISADGATPESYRKYRVGGDFDLVLSNIRHIVEHRRSKGRSRPILEWQVLTFGHLEPELEQVQALAERLGVDRVNRKGPTAPQNLQPASEELKGNFYGGAAACGLLWHNVVLQSDGGIAPCCNLYHREDDFGHLDHGTVTQTRRNERYRTARKLFDPRRARELDPELDHPCLRCPIVHAQTHLNEYLAGNRHAFSDAGLMSIPADRSESGGLWHGL